MTSRGFGSLFKRSSSKKPNTRPGHSDTERKEGDSNEANEDENPPKEGLHAGNANDDDGEGNSEFQQLMDGIKQAGKTHDILSKQAIAQERHKAREAGVVEGIKYVASTLTKSLHIKRGACVIIQSSSHLNKDASVIGSNGEEGRPKSEENDSSSVDETNAGTTGPKLSRNEGKTGSTEGERRPASEGSNSTGVGETGSTGEEGRSAEIHNSCAVDKTNADMTGQKLTPDEGEKLLRKDANTSKSDGETSFSGVKRNASEESDAKNRFREFYEKMNFTVKEIEIGQDIEDQVPDGCDFLSVHTVCKVDDDQKRTLFQKIKETKKCIPKLIMMIIQLDETSVREVEEEILENTTIVYTADSGYSNDFINVLSKHCRTLNLQTMCQILENERSYEVDMGKAKYPRYHYVDQRLEAEIFFDTENY